MDKKADEELFDSLMVRMIKWRKTLLKKAEDAGDLERAAELKEKIEFLEEIYKRDYAPE